mgnify:FL=1|tara:strand:+ start:2237 stop:2425 length:189 start_codon:yes stop_codon:yes gene_type:complete
MTTQTLSIYYCRICDSISNGLKTIGNGCISFFETAGTARAAAELTRQGYHKEARALMMDLKK